MSTEEGVLLPVRRNIVAGGIFLKCRSLRELAQINEALNDGVIIALIEVLVPIFM